LQGSHLEFTGSSGSNPEQFDTSGSAAVNDKEKLSVVDIGNNRIHKFEPVSPKK